MNWILVIGGYGGFGARLCRRLAAAGHRVLVGGRSAAKAEAFCAELPGAEALVVDRDGDVAAILSRHRPELVIDAAGPFQASDYRVPRACIAARIPYLDLADARDFVAGIGALEGEARAAGVAVVSGASSVPALSGAVARRLAEGLDRVHVVDVALSAANRASGGPSVIEAILSYVGRPVRLWRAGRWTEAFGWQEMVRVPFRFADGDGLGGRLVAIADVPDHELLPDLLPGRPAVTFRAGTELAFQMRTLWLSSWLVRWGWLGSLRRAARWLLPLYRLTLGIGGNRSAMRVVLKGEVDGAFVERCWTLVATKGEGVEIPTLAAAILAEDLLTGRQPAGARHAASLLSLDRFEPAFARLAVRHETSERPLPPPLYVRVMGEAFDRLPPMVGRIHQLCGDAGAAGEGTVRRGGNWAARLIGAMMRFPPAGTVPLHVAYAERDGKERWTRDFGGRRFSSELSGKDGRIVERFGALRFAFDVPGGPEGLEMQLHHWSLLGIPMPRFLGPRIAASEWQSGDRFRFDVRVAMPLIGEVIHYSGWLRRLDDQALFVTECAPAPFPESAPLVVGAVL
jgi:hypothetical protein